MLDWRDCGSRGRLHEAIGGTGRRVPSRETLAILTSFQALYAIAALAAHFADMPDVIMFIGWAALGVSQRTILRFLASQRRVISLRRRRA